MFSPLPYLDLSLFSDPGLITKCLGEPSYDIPYYRVTFLLAFPVPEPHPSLVLLSVPLYGGVTICLP